MTSIAPPSSQPVYQASGLSSGLDTQGIIDKLVGVESAPLQKLQQQEAGITVKLSTVAAISGALSSLQGIAKNLASTGINAVAAVGTYSDFTVTGAPTTAADYDVKVTSLAHAAKARSTTTYADGTAVVTATDQTLKLSVDGQEYDVDVKAGTTLQDLVTQINAGTGAHKPDGTAVTLPFSAAMVSDGTSSYLNITNNNPGFVVGQPASSALVVTQDIGLGLSTPANLQATNAVVVVDGLTINRRSNQLTDVIPGATLGLKNASNTDVDLSFQPDATSATSRLQGFVNAYNKVQALLSSQMDTDTSNRNADGTTSNPDTLLGSNFSLNIQYRLQSFLSQQVNATGAIRSLHDLGVSLQADGTLSLDSSVLNQALATDPNAVNQVFSTKTTGLGDSIDTWVKSQTDPFTGALTAQTSGLNATNKQLQDQVDALNQHITAYRAQLNIQFSALESMMTGINSTAQFLDQQAAQSKK